MKVTGLSFEPLALRTAATVADAVADQVAGAERRLAEEVRRLNRTVFHLLAQQALDRPGPPALAEFTPAWVALTPGYVEWKRRHGLSPNFYRKTGDLERRLQRLDPAALGLGEPRVWTSGGPQGNPFVRLVTTVVRGQPQTRARFLAGAVDAVGRKLGGRFAKLAEVLRLFPHVLHVQPFPALDGVPDAELPERLFPGDPAAAKLTNPRHQTLRPVLGPFLRWYARYKIRDAIERAVR